MKEANTAPIYVYLYKGLAEITRKHGYALCVHGSVARDFDLVAVPWVDKPSAPIVVIDSILENYALKNMGEPEIRQHGRMVFTLSFTGDSFLDLSFMPIQPILK